MHPGPSQPCSRGGVSNTRAQMRALSPGHICLCHVEEQQGPRPGSDGEPKQDGHVSGPSRPLGRYCSHHHNSALMTPKAPPSSPETALLNPLASIQGASKHGLSWPHSWGTVCVYSTNCISAQSS